MVTRRSHIAVAFTTIALAAGATFGDGSNIAQEVVEQLPARGSVRSIARQVPLLVQPADVPQTADLADIVWAGCGIEVADGEKAVRNAKFRYSANVAFITQFGQITSVVERSGNAKTNKQGFVTFDIPIGANVTQWLSGVFSVLFVDITGTNNKKLDWFAARCRVNFVQPCEADEATACVGNGRFEVTLGNGWEVTGSNNLTAIFENGGTQVEVDVLDTCPEGYYAVADRVGGTTAFDAEVFDLWTGGRTFVSEPGEAFHLSECY